MKAWCLLLLLLLIQPAFSAHEASMSLTPVYSKGGAEAEFELQLQNKGPDAVGKVELYLPSIGGEVLYPLITVSVPEGWSYEAVRHAETGQLIAVRWAANPGNEIGVNQSLSFGFKAVVPKAEKAYAWKVLSVDAKRGKQSLELLTHVDNTPPRLIAAHTIAPGQIELSFSEPLRVETVELKDFSMDWEVEELEVEVARVLLKGAEFTTNATFKLKVVAGALQDVAGNENEAIEARVEDGIAPAVEWFMSTQVFSPNGDGVKDSFSLGFNFSEPSSWDLLIRDWVGNTVYSLSDKGSKQLQWNGTDWKGKVLADGVYGLSLIYADQRGNRGTLNFSLTIDTTPPHLRADAIVVRANPKGVEDGIEGLKGATEPNASLRFYADANLTKLIANATATPEGGFKVGIGDDACAEVWILVEDGAGNRAVLSKLNPVILPPTGLVVGVELSWVAVFLASIALLISLANFFRLRRSSSS